MAKSETAAPGALSFERGEIERSVGDRFDMVARAFPDRPAVRTPEGETTYAELAAAASSIAHALAGRLPPGPRPVALAMPPGAPLFAAITQSVTWADLRAYAPLLGFDALVAIVLAATALARR